MMPNAVFWGAGAPAKASQQRGLLRCDNNTLLGSYVVVKS